MQGSGLIEKHQNIHPASKSFRKRPVLQQSLAHVRLKQSRCKIGRVQQGKRDPLDADVWDSWQSQDEDWDTEKFTEDELIDILFEVRLS